MARTPPDFLKNWTKKSINFTAVSCNLLKLSVDDNAAQADFGLIWPVIGGEVIHLLLAVHIFKLPTALHSGVYPQGRHILKKIITPVTQYIYS